MNSTADRFHVRRTLGAYLVVDRAAEARLAEATDRAFTPEEAERAEALDLGLVTAAAVAAAYPFTEDGLAAKAQAVGQAAALNLAASSSSRPEPPVEE